MPVSACLRVGFPHFLFALSAVCVTAAAMACAPAAPAVPVAPAAQDAADAQAGAAAEPPPEVAGLHVEPNPVALAGHFSEVQLIVRASAAPSDEAALSAADFTHAARYQSADPGIASVDPSGRVTAVADGTTEIVVTHAAGARRIPVTVSGVDGPPQVTFDDHIRPLISRLGCNAGACHASQFGKGGFVLSVVGFDPKLDHQSMVRDRFQRRVNLVNPENSLLLRKPSMQVPHGGGQRLTRGSRAWQMLVAWLERGAPGPQPETPKVTGIAVTPAERLGQPGERQQLRVVADFSDGTQRDVTRLARFDSTDDAVVSVTPEGRVTIEGQGQAPVMVRYEGQADISLFVAPYGPPPELPDWTSRTFIDELAVRKFQELGLPPSGLCDDATFVRRVFLDTIGTLPTRDQTLAFLADDRSDKRERLVDELLGLTGDPERDRFNDQYAAYWTLKWSDLLRNSTQGQRADEQRMWAMHNWIRESFRTNKPLDEFVRELITAKGSIYSSGPASYYRIHGNSSELAEATAQLFLGVRLQCAKCHHHPFESYSQADYYGFAAFFARVGNKSSEEFGLFGRETVVMVRSSGDVRHPRTGQRMAPTVLQGEEVDHELDRRIPLADWLTAPDNRGFARSVVNRYVSYLLGRGLVEPVDDLRATNPPTNPALMDALADHFIEHGTDLKQLIRVILNSRLYQLDSRPTPQNMADRKFYSHYRVKRLAAEPLLDALDAVTGSPTKFRGLPAGTRAIELPDGEYPNYFLTTFGKPRRVSVCECERVPDENLSQALHTLNGDIVSSKISDGTGRLATLLAGDATDEDLVDELYVVALSRHATKDEIAATLAFRPEAASRKEFFEDLLWSLVNSKQFLFIH